MIQLLKGDLPLLAAMEEAQQKRDPDVEAARAIPAAAWRISIADKHRQRMRDVARRSIAHIWYDEVASVDADAWRKLTRNGNYGETWWVLDQIEQELAAMTLRDARDSMEKQEEVERIKAQLRRRPKWVNRLTRLFNVEILMNEVKTLGADRAITPREIAERELAAEKRAAAVAKIKDLLKKRDAAQTVLANIEREIADAEQAIAQGNLV